MYSDDAKTTIYLIFQIENLRVSWFRGKKFKHDT